MSALSMRLNEKHPYQNDTDAKLFYTHCPFAMGFFAGEYAGYMHGLRRGAPAIQRPATRHADGKAVLAVSPYHAASYAPSRVARGLSFEVIAPVVNDDRLSNDFFWRKPLCIEALPRIAAIAKQRRHIPCVCRMRTIIRIIMPACIGEIARTAASGMNVDGIDVWRARRGVIRKPPKLRKHYGSVSIGIEAHRPMQLRMLRTALNTGAGSRARTHGGYNGYIF